MAVQFAGDIIRLALRDLGAIAAGDDPSQEEYEDALDDFNVMLQSWAADESLLPRRSYDALTVSSSGVTIGPGKTLDTTERVLKILGATLRASGVDQPLTVGQLPDYQRIQNKSAGGLPRQIFLNPGAVSSGIVYFDRVPDVAYTLLLDTQEQFSMYQAITDVINLAAEYYLPLQLNLEVRLSNQYPGLTPAIAAEARRSKERLQHLNHGYLLPESMPSSDLVV